MTWQIKAAAILLALAGILVLGWTVNGWRLTSAANAKIAKDLQQQQDARKKAEAERDSTAADLRTSSDSAASTLKKAQDENNRLRSAIVLGNQRLRISASCPAIQGLQAVSSPASGVDSGETAQLSTAAGLAFWNIRANIIDTEGRLSACQEELRIRSK